jgi:hypothetical protein
VGAVDISKVLRLSMPSTSRSYLLSFMTAVHSKLVQLLVDLDSWASVRIVMVALSHDSRGGLPMVQGMLEVISLHELSFH